MVVEAVPHERATIELADHLRPVFEASPDGVAYHAVRRVD
jgi:hypothetical protein